MERLAIPIFGQGRAITFEADAYFNPLEADASHLVDWFNAKAPQPIGSWRDLGPEEYARAFTAARTAGYDVVNDLQREFVAVMATSGSTSVDFQAQVLPIMRDKGWLPKLDDRQLATRLQLIFDTNLRVAQASGRWARIQRTAVALPYLVGFTAKDDRVRLRHRPFEGIVLPTDHPFWRTYFPPLGFRCRCNVVQRSRGQLARSGLQVTSEAELASRIQQMGPTFGFNPALNPLHTNELAADRANAERLPRADPISVERERARAREAWEAEVARKAKREFRSPIDPEVNAATIKVEPRLKLQKRLREEFAEAARESGYAGPQDRWGGRSAKDRGNATFAAAFDDHGASLVAAIKPELDNLARQAGVPRLRGFKTISGGKAIANQGDGIMGLNAPYFNGWAGRLGGRASGSGLEELAAQRLAIRAQIEPMVEEAQALRLKMTQGRFEGLQLADKTRDPEWIALGDQTDALLRKIGKLRDQDSKLWKKENVLKRGDKRAAEVSTWKTGDDPKKRPWTVEDYFEEPVDKARSVLFHEFGHHIHQYLEKGNLPRRAATPPLERALRAGFRHYMSGRKGRSASRYSEKNEHEWFAENFSLFAMGRRDLVDSGALELLETIFRGEFKP